MSDFDSKISSLIFSTEKFFTALSLRQELSRKDRELKERAEAHEQLKERKDQEDRDRDQKRRTQALEVYMKWQ